MKKFFKTKYNYHDSDISGYKWVGDDLVIQIDPCGTAAPSEIRFTDVKNRDDVERDLSARDYRKPSMNIYDVAKTGKQEFTVFVSPPLKIACGNMIEL